jgi:hypothetical protein
MRGKHPKQAKPPKPKIAVFGPAGVGKTWGSLDWPMCYFLDCEGGASLPHYVAKLTKAEALYVGPEDGADDPEVVLQEVKDLATKKHDRKTLIVDSYSYIYNAMLLREYQRLIDKGQDPEGFFGRDKKPAIAFSKKMLAWIEKLDLNVLMICHAKDEWKDGKVVRQTFDGWEKCEYALNLILHVSKQGTRRVAKTMKSRFEQFPEGEVFDWSYEVFGERFGYSTLESEPTTITLATPSQVAELERLIESINFDKELTDKWKDKAQVDAWAEMSSGDIQKCIDYLTAKLPKSAA